MPSCYQFQNRIAFVSRAESVAFSHYVHSFACQLVPASENDAIDDKGVSNIGTSNVRLWCGACVSVEV